MTFTGLKPEYIHVRFASREADLIHYRLGQGEPQALIMAGVHGREHGGVQAAYELLERLTAMSLRGQIDILPVCNRPIRAAQVRGSPSAPR
jgi:predicted deacylase